LIDALTGHVDLVALIVIGRLQAAGAHFPLTAANIVDIQDLPRTKPSPWITDCAYGARFGGLHGMPERNIPNIGNSLINRAPILTLWAATVAERMGCDGDEAL
jgi:hypothetical protein